MDDLKKGFREVQQNVKEGIRGHDGTDLKDHVGNIGDEGRKDLGNLGDDVRSSGDQTYGDQPYGDQTDRTYPETPLSDKTM